MTNRISQAESKPGSEEVWSWVDLSSVMLSDPESYRDEAHSNIPAFFSEVESFRLPFDSAQGDNSNPPCGAILKLGSEEVRSRIDLSTVMLSDPESYRDEAHSNIPAFFSEVESFRLPFDSAQGDKRNPPCGAILKLGSEEVRSRIDLSTVMLSEVEALRQLTCESISKGFEWGLLKF